tara:strand:- start:431 stop:625 length:195 start_codon:yes stop_codon:yes gene_type:complete
MLAWRRIALPRHRALAGCTPLARPAGACQNRPDRVGNRQFRGVRFAHDGREARVSGDAREGEFS